MMAPGRTWVRVLLLAALCANVAQGRPASWELAPRAAPRSSATRSPPCTAAVRNTIRLERPSEPVLTEAAVLVENEQQLYAALGIRGLGWSDRRPIQLVADIQLSTTLVLGSPVRLQGACPGHPHGRCVISAARPVPLVLATGPTAVVELTNLVMRGGTGAAALAGGLTASNHASVDLLRVDLEGNRGPAAGGALRVDSGAQAFLLHCSLTGNAAAGAGGGAYLRTGELHLRDTVISGNEAAAGGGVYLSDSSRLVGHESTVTRNRLTENEGTAMGADLLLADDRSEAAMDPLPRIGETVVAGGELRSAAEPGEPEPAWRSIAPELQEVTGSRGASRSLQATTNVVGVRRAGWVGGRRRGAAPGGPPRS